MAGGLGDYTEQRMLDKLLGGTNYTPAATHYLALLTTAPNPGGSGYTELAAGGYARISKTNNTTTWKNWASAQKLIGVSTTWGPATVDWPEVVAVGVFDAATAGNLLGWGLLVDRRTVANTESLTLPVDGFSITFLGRSTGNGGIGDHAAQQLMDKEFGNTDFTPATNHYFATFTTNPNPAGTGAVESSGGGYARQSKTNNTTTWSNWTSGLKANGAAINWTAFTANMITMVGVGVYDATTAGNLLVWAKITNPRAPLSGQTLDIGVGSMRLSEVT